MYISKKNVVKDDFYDCFETEVQYFVIYGLIIKICGFAICGLANSRNLRICVSGISPRIFADLLFPDLFFVLLHNHSYTVTLPYSISTNSPQILSAIHFVRMYYKELIKSCYLIKKARKKHMYRLGDFGHCLNRDYVSD
jgi:hypothetical protein